MKATFTEPKYMNANSHPHPYGIVIAGNDLGTPQQSYLYCSAYGNGNFIVRGFGPSEMRDRQLFNMTGRGAANEAVHKAAGPGQPVTQDIAVTVKADSVECAINGTVVATYPKADVVAPGKLKSTDGVYGIRFAHNTDATVTGLTSSSKGTSPGASRDAAAPVSWSAIDERHAPGAASSGVYHRPAGLQVEFPQSTWTRAIEPPSRTRFTCPFPSLHPVPMSRSRKARRRAGR